MNVVLPAAGEGVAVGLQVAALAGWGYPLARRAFEDPLLRFLAAFGLGSLIAAWGQSVLSALGRLDGPTSAAVLVPGLGLAFLYRDQFVHPARAAAEEVFAPVLQGPERWLLVLLCGAALLYWIDASSPPRSADAMRYHLAQLQDIDQHGGFVFRPYYHYNLPLFFTYLAYPLFALLGEGPAKLLVLAYVPILVLIAVRLASELGVQRRQLVAVLLVLTPAMLYSATTFRNDLPTAVYALTAVLLLSRWQEGVGWTPLLLGFSSLGLALGTKYQAILFAPWCLWLVWKATARLHPGSRLSLLAAGASACLVAMAPNLIRNFVYTGDPVWPFFQELFPVPRDLFHDLTTRYTEALAGSRSVPAFARALAGLVIANPFVPVTIWALAGLGLWAGRTNALRPAFGVATYLSFWWVLQPRLYPRFVVFVLPLFAALSVKGFESLRPSRWGRLATAAFGMTVAYGAGVLGLYSWDALRFRVDGDAARYHRATWFHSEYDWMDRHLPPSAKLLVIVSSGQTYYARRPYLRGDPGLSAAIDWRRLGSSRELRRILENEGIDYVFYERRDWSRQAGGDRMMALVEGLVAEGLADLVWERPVDLYTLRVLGRKRSSQVRLLRLEGGDGGSG